MARRTAFKDSTSFEKGLGFAKGNSMFHFEVIGPVPRPSSLQRSKVESEKSLAGGLCKNVISLLRMGCHVGNHRLSFKCQYTQMHFGCAWSSLKYAEWKKKKNLLLVWIEFAGFQKLHWLNSSNIYQADFNSQSSRVTNLCSKWLAGQNFGDLNRKQWIKCFYLWHVKFFIVQCMYSGCMFLFLSVKSSFLYRSDNTQLKKMKTR